MSAALVARRLPLLSLAAFATMAALRVCDPLLPSLTRQFDVSTGQAGQAISVFAIAYGLALLLYGPLGDRYGKFTVMAIATLACTAGGVACATAQSMRGLIVFRGLWGAAAGGVTPLAMAWIGDNVPYERRQAVLAQLISATTTGLIGGQLLGGILADTVGWRSAFWILALLFAIAGGFMCDDMRRERMAPITARPVPPLSPAVRLHRPWRSVFANQWARRVMGFAFIEGIFVFSGLAYLPSHLHTRFGLPMRWAGSVLVLYGVGGLLYSRSAPLLLRRFGEAGLARLGGLLLCLYFVMLATLPSWRWALPACLAGGVGFYMLHNTLQAHATQMAPEVRATAVTLFSSSLFLGHSLGVAVAAIVVDIASAIPVFVTSALFLPLVAWRFAVDIGKRRSVSERLTK